MKNITEISVAIIICIFVMACDTIKNQKEMTSENTTALFLKGEKLTNGYFTGDAYLNTLLARNRNNDFVIGAVTFEPTARTNWHTHPKGQVLIVTEGEGLYQEKGKPAQSIKKGDVVNIPENTEHWHGATTTTKMVHIAITNYEGETNAVWLNAVTDEEYKQSNNR